MKNVPPNSTLQNSFVDIIKKFCLKTFPEEEIHVQGLLAFTLSKDQVVLINVTQDINKYKPVINCVNKNVVRIEPKPEKLKEQQTQSILQKNITVLKEKSSPILNETDSSNTSIRSSPINCSNVNDPNLSNKHRRKGQPKRRKSINSPAVFEVPSQVPLSVKFNVKRTKIDSSFGNERKGESTSDSDCGDNGNIIKKEINESVNEEMDYYSISLGKTDNNSNLIAWPSPQIDESDCNSINDSSMNDSMFSASPKTEPILNERGRVECQICQKELYDKSSLNHHMLIHKGIKPFKCPICHTTYRQKITMQRHMATHFNVDKKFCELCGFKDKSQRKVFMHRVKEHGLPISANTFSDPMPPDTAMTVRQTSYPVAMPEKLAPQLRYPTEKEKISFDIPEYPGSLNSSDNKENDSDADLDKDSDDGGMVMDLTAPSTSEQILEQVPPRQIKQKFKKIIA